MQHYGVGFWANSVMSTVSRLGLGSRDWMESGFEGFGVRRIVAVDEGCLSVNYAGTANFPGERGVCDDHCAL